jgi:hypothetical protein
VAQLKSSGNVKALMAREDTARQLYDAQERAAIKSAKVIGFEPSPDSDEPSQHQVTSDKYRKDGFCVSDSDSADSDDATATICSDDVNSVESESAHFHRVENLFVKFKFP